MIILHFLTLDTQLDHLRHGESQVSPYGFLHNHEVSADERRLGKTINFGGIGRMGTPCFASETSASQVAAKEFATKYQQRSLTVYAFKVFAFLELQER